MRVLTLAAALAQLTLAVVPSWAEGQAETGREIVAACKAYLALPPDAAENALHPQHHCRKFVASFLSAYAMGENIGAASRVTGVGSAAVQVCVRLPEYLSFRDMASRMVAFAESDPTVLDNLATDLARKTLERDFPCEAR